MSLPPATETQETETEKKARSQPSFFWSSVRRLFHISENANELAPVFKGTDIFPAAALAVPHNHIWYSIRIVPLSVERTVLVYDIYCKPGTASEEVAALRGASSRVVWGLEKRWSNCGDPRYAHVYFLLLLSLFLSVCVFRLQFQG